MEIANSVETNSKLYACFFTIIILLVVFFNL